MYPYECTISGYSWSKAYLFSNSIVCKNLMMANNFSCGAYISGIVIKRHSTGTIIINDRKRREKEVDRERERTSDGYQPHQNISDSRFKLLNKAIY